MKKLISTKIIENHPKVGPFFVKEFIMLIGVVMMAFNVFIILSLYINIPKLPVLVCLAIFIFMAGLWRHFNKEKSNTWYLEEVLSYYMQPKHLDAYKIFMNFKKEPSKYEL